VKTIDEWNLKALGSGFTINSTVNQLGIWLQNRKMDLILLPEDKNSASIMSEVPATKLSSHDFLNGNLIQLSFQHNHDVNFLAVKEALHRMMFQRQIKASDVPRGNDHGFGREEASPTLVTALWFLPLWTSACISLVWVVFMSCTVLPFFWCFVFTWTNPSSIGSSNSVFPVSLRSEELWRTWTWFATRTCFLWGLYFSIYMCVCERERENCVQLIPIYLVITYNSNHA